MAIGCGPKCAKFLLIVFNFIFWLSGAAVLGVGIWLRVDKSVIEYLKVLTINADDPVLNYAAYVLIGIGTFVFIVGFFGCCGAIRESKCMLGLYIFFMVIVMAGELAAGIAAVIYKGKVEDQLDAHMLKTIKQEYIANSSIALAWDFAQYKLTCCGASGYADYDNSKWENMTGMGRGWKVPPSCCVFKDTKEDDISKVKPKDTTKCESEAVGGTGAPSGFLNKKGCKEQLMAWFKGHTVILIGVGIGIACLEIFGVIFAVCLCRNVGEEE